MLAVAVVFNGIQFAERIFGLSMPSSQFIAHEQQDVDGRGSATTGNARPLVAVQGDKPFVDRLATGQPAVAPASLAPASGSNDTYRPYQRWRAGSEPPRSSGATPTERMAAPPKVKVAAKVANPDVAEAHFPAKQKAVMTASVRPPPASPVRAAPPAAARADEGDGLYVAVLSTHKEAARRRKSSPNCRKSLPEFSAQNSPRSRSSAVKPASWHRLVATPASTKAAANEICNDLRSAGYGRCWVKAY